MSESQNLSPVDWVRDQTQRILETGTTRSVDIMGMQVVLLTTTGAKSGRTRLVPLMRVEHDGTYAAVASKGGADEHPQWYYNLLAYPDITLQDGTEVSKVRAEIVDGAEREQWWERCVAAYPPYADYQARTERIIPVFVLRPRP